MPFVIWSIEHTAWWGPDRRGYTRELAGAGVYDAGDTRAILEEANVVGVQECAIPFECVRRRAPQTDQNLDLARLHLGKQGS